MKSTTPSAKRIGMALAGGGPEGAIYELGALRALEEAIGGLDLRALDIYVGVSAGACIAANLANQIPLEEMCRAVLRKASAGADDEHPFVPETFLQPALGELFRRGTRVPRLLAQAIADWARHPFDLPLSESLLRLTRALPVAVLDSAPLRRYLRRIYGQPGRTDDFRQLGRKLVVVAAELESGEAVRFGEPGYDDVPISLAVQASTALPGLYPPVEIDGCHYVDGVLLKTLHASVALDHGAGLVLCVNPIVPVDMSHRAGSNGNGNGHQENSIVERGLPSVLSQTFRTLIYSRMQVGIAAYAERYPGADVLLFEPRRDDPRMFFTNIFTFSARKAVCEYAYVATRRDLRERADQLEPVLARHGLRLRRDVLADDSRTIWQSLDFDRQGRTQPAGTLSRLESLLDRLERALPAE